MADPRPLIEALRMGHDPGVTWGAGCVLAIRDNGRCTCGADAHNARVDALLAAIDEEVKHGDRLAEALEVNCAVRVMLRMGSAFACTCCGGTTSHSSDCNVGVAIATHRALRGEVK